MTQPEALGEALEYGPDGFPGQGWAGLAAYLPEDGAVDLPCLAVDVLIPAC